MADTKDAPGYLAVVQLILISIKVNGVGAIAAQSWWLILLPLWIWIALALIGLVILAIKA